MPHTQQLHARYKDKGLAVIGVHVSRGASRAQAFVRSHGLTFPVLLDDGGTSGRYGIRAIPTYFLVDRRGRIVSGPTHTPPSAEEIERLLAQDP